MEQLDVIGRTSELARLFGIQFYEVFTRGSQVHSVDCSWAIELKIQLALFLIVSS